MKHPRLTLTHTALVIGLALAGCASHPLAPTALNVRPTYAVHNGGQVDLSYGYVARAREMEAEHRLDQAAIWWARAIGAAPQRADAHHGLGLCLARMGRLGEGIASLREAAALAPDDPRILNNLGHALKLQGEPQEAATMFEAALRADPHYELARYNLAMLQDKGLSMALLSAPAPAAERTAPSDDTPPRLALSLTPSLSVQRSPNVAALSQVSTADAPAALKADTTLKVVPLTAVALNEPAPAASQMSVTLTGVTVEVFNGNGVAGAARDVRDALAQHGLKTGRIANMARYDVPNTRIVYRPGKAAQARALARLLHTSAELAQASATQESGMRADVRVVLGRDLDSRRTNVALANTPDGQQL
jgi:hypothetical protein